MPYLHDAGVEDAPQMLSGKQEDPRPVSEERKAQARESLRASIISAVKGIDTDDEEALSACADEILSILGQGTHSISVAMTFGIALTSGRLTLADLVDISATVCGKCVAKMTNDERLDWRKKILRLLDSLSLGGCGVYEHKLRNGQLLYGLMPPESED